MDRMQFLVGSPLLDDELDFELGLLVFCLSFVTSALPLFISLLVLAGICHRPLYLEVTGSAFA